MKKTITNPFRFFLKHAGNSLRLAGLLVGFALMHLTAMAQTGKVSGKITNAQGEPLSGVTIHVRNSNISTTTDAEGNYTISAASTDVLEISYVGFRSTQMPVAGKTEVTLSLQPAINTMNDIVVVGYNTQRKNAITGAVSQVNMNNISKTHIADVGQSLQGQVAGVFVSANTGAPGDGIKLRIRGEGTLGNNEVLYVVDGVPTRDISFLNSSDILSMTVLKDASATAIYGSRAAGGVVVITTRTGQKGKMAIDVDYYSGFYRATNLPKMLNADQYLTVKDMAWHNTILNNGVGPQRLPSDVSPYAADRLTRTLANTDWLDELFTGGVSNNLQVSASGGTDKVQYLLSAGYFGQDGIVVEKNDGYQRFNFRTNINANVTDRLTVGTNLLLSYTKQDKLSSSGDAPGVIRHALLRSPVLSVYKDPSDPTYSAEDPYTDLPFYTDFNNGWSKDYEYSSNPLAIVHFTDDTRKNYQTFGNLFAEYGFLKNKELKLRSSMGVDINFAHNKNFAENYGDDDNTDAGNIYHGMGRKNKPNNLDENFGQTMTFTWSNTLNYQKTINSKHLINALVGHEYISSNSNGIGGSRQNFDNTTSGFRYLDYGSLTLPYSGGSASNWSLLSFFTTGTYGYDNKYFATASFRADASSRFGPNNKWGYFPSVSAGWRITGEDFMQNAKWISNLKLRGSWGQSGNQEIPNNAYQTIVTKVGGVVNRIRIGNPDVKWETTTQTDIGLDFGVMNNKLNFSVDYFNKKTDDILLTVGLPSVSVGVIQATFVNAGQVTNKGFELGINYQNNDHPFKYSVNGNLGTVKNNVTKLQTYVKNLQDGATHTISVPGQPISSYYGYQFAGIYQNQAEITSYLPTNSSGIFPGDIKFKDINGDGQINADDRTYIGNPTPKLTYGLSFFGEFKQFDFSFLFQGVQGVDRYNDLKQITNYDSRPFNSTTDVLDSWHGEGTSNTLPRLTFNNNGGAYVSDVFVEDASYLRLKNIEVGYSFNTKRMGMKNLRIYVSAQNVFTVTNYTGLDPESTSLIDRGTYPQMKAFIAGLKIKL